MIELNTRLVWVFECEWLIEVFLAPSAGEGWRQEQIVDMWEQELGSPQPHIKPPLFWEWIEI